jgi:hypothetical protein
MTFTSCLFLLVRFVCTGSLLHLLLEIVRLYVDLNPLYIVHPLGSKKSIYLISCLVLNCLYS